MESNGHVETKLILGDSREILPTLNTYSVDLIITDPPYPCAPRDYGEWSEKEWFEMMEVVVPECMRLIKRKGSCTFILQPNSEKLGRMRLWLWKFLVWVGERWNIVQDLYWWNICAIPESHAVNGLTRPSLKYFIWLGHPDCYRNQDRVLWQPSDSQMAQNRASKAVFNNPSGHCKYVAKVCATVDRRGGTTPFNVIPMANSDSTNSGGAYGHGAATPLELCKWFVRYLCPEGGTVLDPFSGTGTVGLATKAYGCNYIGIEKLEKYYNISRRRLLTGKLTPPIQERVI